MGFSRQESWSGLPFSSPADLPDPGIETALQTDSLLTELQAILLPNSYFIFLSFYSYLLLIFPLFFLFQCFLSKLLPPLPPTSILHEIFRAEERIDASLSSGEVGLVRVTCKLGGAGREKVARPWTPSVRTVMWVHLEKQEGLCTLCM